jgi:hypothetical protein
VIAFQPGLLSGGWSKSEKKKRSIMKSLLTLCLVFLLLTTSLALATETRVLSMGGVNDIVRDDANISLYPQTVAQYGGLFTVESSSDNMFNMGANWTMGESVLGAYFPDSITRFIMSSTMIRTPWTTS